MDPRSAKKNTYSLEDQQSPGPPICGVELTIMEGRQDLREPSQDVLAQTRLPSTPSMQQPTMDPMDPSMAPSAPSGGRGARRNASVPMAPETPPLGFPPKAGGKVGDSEADAVGRRALGVAEGWMVVDGGGWWLLVGGWWLVVGDG
eukprot:Skav205983  [mRNA]  locus=scaffold442:1034609:1036267:- [translate_table: standard]